MSAWVASAFHGGRGCATLNPNHRLHPHTKTVVRSHASRNHRRCTAESGGMMGRASRRRAENRRERALGGRAAIDWVEQRGRRVPPTMAGYEAAAARVGARGVKEALISRHNVRM